MDTKQALKSHMAKGPKAAHPDANTKNFAKGGVTTANAKKYGRNVARAMNQRSSSRGG
jgi:hypothetical protein